MRSRLAPAKLNLYLHLTGKRNDGYHLLQSLVVFTDFGDQLSIEDAAEISLELSGPKANLLSREDNIVLKAAHALKARFNVDKGAYIRLEKNIPVGAGLGGGSSDAAALLHLLNAMWELGASDQLLQEIALELGADVPACLLARPLVMRGIGDMLTPCQLEPESVGPLLLVNPGVSLATADVFSHIIKDDFSGPFDAPPQAFMSASNDMQRAAIYCMPVISDILARLAAQPGCRLARMSGSGATCFGLFEHESARNQAQSALRKAHPDWWLQPASMLL